MKFSTARNILSILWLAAALAFGFILFLNVPNLGEDAGEVFKKAGTFWAPFVALVMSFLFGVHVQDKTLPVPNPLSFYAALIISLVHLLALFIAVFFWKHPILQNMALADIGLGYFSFFTVIAMNFFFIGVVQGEKNLGGKTPK